MALAVLIGQARERSRAGRLAGLLQNVSGQMTGPIAFSSFAELPPPVARYFRHVLTDGQQCIKRAKIRQAGLLRTGTRSSSWLSFTADQLIAPAAPGFVWNARVVMPLATHIRVLDSYTAGVGTGRVSLLSAFAVASESDLPELNSGALHRYLAEAVWYPTALLPQSGVRWTPIDDGAALATLTDRGTTVSLEFRFNSAGEVTGVYSPGRFGNFDGEYRQAAWEGYMRNYEVQSGMRVPAYGEVGWYDAGTWQAVWKGDLVDVQYEFAP
ncbi:MAG: hypothetical protein K9M17_04360 [Mariprofundaceae bacterium]|nr:hypothetical protein [Mariprofundaceae bacterium]